MPQVKLITAGYGWIIKKVIKESVTSDPSSKMMRYVEFTVAVVASLTTEQQLEDNKIVPKY